MIGVTSFEEMARIDPTWFDWVNDLGVQPYPVYYDSATKKYKRLTNSSTQVFAWLLMGIQNCDNCLGRVVFDWIIEIKVGSWITPFLVADSTYYLQSDWSLSTTVSAYKIGYSIKDTFDWSDNINFVLDVKATWWYADNVLSLAKSYADSLVVGLYDLRGAYNASSNLFPTTGWSGSAGAVLKWDVWNISVWGTLGWVAVTVWDTILALSDIPWQTSSNWLVGETNFDYVPENVSNKKTTMTWNTTSNTFYLTAKAIYDWAVALFATITTSQNSTDKYAVTAWSATVYTLTLSPAPTAYQAWQIFNAKFHLANTGTATININGLGAKALVKDISTPLVSGDIPINSQYQLLYDGTNFVIKDIGFAGKSLSARLLSALSDATGTWFNVFSISPIFTGTPTAPTATAGTNTTQIATTAHVFAERANSATLTNKTLTSPAITSPVITGTMSVNSQDWTGAWTSWTPTRIDWITISWLSVSSASYKMIGKTAHVQTYLTFTATSSWAYVKFTNPVSMVSKHFAIMSWVNNFTLSQWYVDNVWVAVEANFTNGVAYSLMINYIAEAS